MWFPNRSDTNRPVQLQKQARSLKFLELSRRGFENKGADQLRSYREADLRLCFRRCILLFFPMRRLICDSISMDYLISACVTIQK